MCILLLDHISDHRYVFIVLTVKCSNSFRRYPDIQNTSALCNQHIRLRRTTNKRTSNNKNNATPTIAKVKDKKDKKENQLFGGTSPVRCIFFSLLHLQAAHLHPTHIALLPELTHVHDPASVFFFIAINLTCRLSFPVVSVPFLPCLPHFSHPWQSPPRSLTLYLPCLLFISMFL